MNYSKLLIDEQPLQVLPGLAVAIGLNEAIVLQQIHYWLSPNRKGGEFHEGRKWVYNTYETWQENFPFWSVDTIKRTILKLEKVGVIEATDEFNKDTRDRTKWYTINYDHEILHGGQGRLPSSTDRADCPAHEGRLPHSSIRQRLHTETTAETTSIDTSFASFWKAYPSGNGNKKQSLAQWKKIKPDDNLFTEIMAGLERWKKSRRWQEGFVKAAEIWLRDRWWEDDLPSPSDSTTTKQQRDPAAGVKAIAREMGIDLDADDEPDDIIDTHGRNKP